MNLKEIKYPDFTVVFDCDHHIPFYTWYVLFKEEEDQFGKFERKNDFKPDPNFKELQATNEIYEKSGYDKGHLVPAEDMTFNEGDEHECFHFTNIVPQNEKLNRGQWKALEEHVRKLADEEKMLIITGAYNFKETEKLGDIYIPRTMFKIVVFFDKVGFSEFYKAWVMPNQEVKDFNDYETQNIFFNDTRFRNIIGTILQSLKK